MVELIGQKEAKTFVKGRKSLPNCIIIHGPQQSGKKTLARYIAEKVGYDCIFIDNKVDSIREMIDLSSSLAEPTLFVTHVSEMSNAAKNSLLKVTEEPPKNVHICLIAYSENEVLSTLVSRSWVIPILPYSADEVGFYLEKFVKSSKDVIELSHLFSSPGQIQFVVKHYGKEGLALYLEKVKFFHENIFEASASNALKIVDWFKLKDSDNREDALLPDLFLTLALNWIGWKNRTAPDFEAVWQNNALLIRISACLRQVNTKGRSKTFALNKMIKEVQEIGELDGFDVRYSEQ